MNNNFTTHRNAPTRFRTILADPPWDIGQKDKRLGAARHYDLMTLDRIKRMPIADLAEENAHLYLWVINGALREGMDVMEEWGFTYRAPLTWIKPRFGLGNYLRQQTEHLLLGTRGKAPVKFKGQGTWMYAPLQDHSHKPEEQYAVIERLSDGPISSSSLADRNPVGTPGVTRSTRTSLFRITQSPVISRGLEVRHDQAASQAKGATPCLSKGHCYRGY